MRFTVVMVDLLGYFFRHTIHESGASSIHGTVVYSNCYTILYRRGQHSSGNTAALKMNRDNF